MSVTSKNYFRLPLPDVCIDFACDEGRRLFTESVIHGNAQLYFKMIANFRTQDDVGFCGLSSLVTVLNTLDDNPIGSTNVPRRFYHEYGVDCCDPNIIKRTGMNLEQFSNLAKCNRLDVTLVYAENSEIALREFRNHIIESVSGESHAVVVNFHRRTLKQIGYGHFSPIAAYHAASDSVLILDVGKYKYPPYWVTISALWPSMLALDWYIRRPRGYVKMKIRSNTHPLLLFGVKYNLSKTDEKFAMSVLTWNEFLYCSPLSQASKEISTCCSAFENIFSAYALCRSEIIPKSERPIFGDCNFCRLSSVRHLIYDEVKSIEITKHFQNCEVAALILAWPFEDIDSKRSFMISEAIAQNCRNLSSDTLNEIDVLKTQLRTLVSYSKPQDDKSFPTEYRYYKKPGECTC